MEFPLIQTIVRLLVPLIILRFPLPGILLSMMVDMYDWQVVPHTTKQQYLFYQNWDKTLDLYYQLIILVIVFRCKDIVAQKIAYLLFGYRMIGLFFFFLTQSRMFLVFFPNLLENFVVFYLVSTLFTKKQKLFISTKRVLVVLVFLLIPKLIHEYFQHFLLKQPWEIYNAGAVIGTTGLVQEYTNYLFWGGILYIIPACLILLLVRFKRL